MELLDMTSSNALIEEGNRLNMSIQSSIEEIKRKQIELLSDIAKDTCNILIELCNDELFTREDLQNIIKSEFSMLMSEISRIK